jgi:aminocarboxymuconate-semialdehyde decarboxylase
MQDPDRAAAELDRAVTELGLRGAEICTHINGRDLDHASLRPVYAAAERLGVPLFLHPQNWGDMRRFHDYALWNLAGFPLETALAASHLIMGGVFEQFPGLRVILAHGGGYLPYQVGRLDHGYAARREVHERLPRRPSEYLGNLYCDSLTHSALSLRFLLDRMGDDHIVIGSDYPFNMGDERPVDTVRALRLSPDVEAKVLVKNLAGLLGL